MTEIAIGSIVRAPGRPDVPRWVVAEIVGSPEGSPPWLRLMGWQHAGRPTSYTERWAAVEVLDTPTVALGDAVTVRGRAGVVVGLAPLEGVARVLLKPHTRQLRSGGFILKTNIVTSAPLWCLIMENAL